jgi:hypothetical protein
MNAPFFNFQQIAAKISILCFLGTACVVIVSLLGLAALLLARKRRYAGWLAAGVALEAALYAAVLMGFSLASRDELLSQGQQKYFCEVDCHLAYSLLEVKTLPQLGDRLHEVVAGGTFYLVRIRTWFDERTISPWRPKDVPLTRSPRRVLVVDETGREFLPSPAGQQALESVEGLQASLSGPLTPGQSSATDLVFDLPGSVKNPRLLIADSEGVTRFLIGNENSLFHAKTYFELIPGTALNKPAARKATDLPSPRVSD